MNAATELMVTQSDAMGHHIKIEQTILIKIDEGDGFGE